MHRRLATVLTLALALVASGIASVGHVAAHAAEAAGALASRAAHPDAPARALADAFVPHVGHAHRHDRDGHRDHGSADVEAEELRCLGYHLFCGAQGLPVAGPADLPAPERGVHGPAAAVADLASSGPGRPSIRGPPVATRSILS